MKQSILEILQAFMSGDLTPKAANNALLGHFQAQSSEKRQAMARQYIDEMVADLEAGLVSIDIAAEGLEESAAASHL